MITRIVKMTFKSGEIESFKAIFESSKEKIRNFPGNKGLKLLQDKQDGEVFFTYSLWADESDLENYRHSELFKTTWAKTKVLFDGKPEAWSTSELHSL